MGGAIVFAVAVLAGTVGLVVLAIRTNHPSTPQTRHDDVYGQAQELVAAWRAGEVELQPVWTDWYPTAWEADMARSVWLPLYTASEGRWVTRPGGHQVKEVTYTRRPWYEIEQYRQVQVGEPRPPVPR